MDYQRRAAAWINDFFASLAGSKHEDFTSDYQRCTIFFSPAMGNPTVLYPGIIRPEDADIEEKRWFKMWETFEMFYAQKRP
jgi:hypothetical protein